ncbi:ParA family protein [Brooklawnia sp.]|uniref:ParA family protein n=1 Tax=Brooklawnia sp. TaxID=2699740 RepID=UPI00311D7495
MKSSPKGSTVSRETQLPSPQQTRTIVIVNQKGGVGKTTTAVNVASALARGGLKVLMMDLDPQGNASTALGINHQPGIAGTYEVLLQHAKIADVQQPSPESENLVVVPATIDLAGAEIELVPQVAREQRLRKAVSAHLADSAVDYVIFDCPPSLGLLTLNALVAANEILMPIQCEYYALEGVGHLLRTIDLVKDELNPELEIGTVLLTMFDARTKLSAQVGEQVRQYFPDQTLVTLIPRSVRLSEAPSYGQTILGYDPQSVGAKAYRRAAEEIAQRGARLSVEAATVGATR